MLGVPHDATPSPAYLGMSLQLEPTTALFFLIFTKSFCNKNRAKYSNHVNARPNHRPPAQRSSNSASFTCTSMASIGSNRSSGDPGIHGVAGPWVGGNDAVPHGHSTPIIIASESDHGSSYASPCDPSMTDSQSHEHRCLSGSTPSSRSVCLALSSLSSPHSLLSVVGGLGSCVSSPSSNVEESLGQLTSQWALSLVIWATSSGMRGT